MKNERFAQQDDSHIIVLLCVPEFEHVVRQSFNKDCQKNDDEKLGLE